MLRNEAHLRLIISWVGDWGTLPEKKCDGRRPVGDHRTTKSAPNRLRGHGLNAAEPVNGLRSQVIYDLYRDGGGMDLGGVKIIGPLTQRSLSVTSADSRQLSAPDCRLMERYGRRMTVLGSGLVVNHCT